LADTVLKVFADPALQRRVTEAGLRFVRDERTWAHSVAGYEAVYRRFAASEAR
jgi:hypothetical protein